MPDTTTEQAVLTIYKDGNLAAIVVRNGIPKFYMTTEASYQDIQQLLDANKMKP